MPDLVNAGSRHRHSKIQMPHPAKTARMGHPAPDKSNTLQTPGHPSRKAASFSGSVGNHGASDFYIIDVEQI
jgi:hypothetical protein